MMRTNIRKTILLLIIIGVLLLILFTFASIGYEQFTNVKNRQIQKAIEQNMALWQMSNEQ